MKQVLVRIPMELYDSLKMHTIQNDTSISAYVHSLICQDLGMETHKNFITISIRIPEQEYAQLKQAVKESGLPIKNFVEGLAAEDLKHGSISGKFDAENTSGSSRMLSFSTDKAFHKAMKQRAAELDISFQDYIKSLIYEKTH